MKPYLYFNGLLELSKVIKGDENVFLGIRPYGFHAGNMTSLVIYPLLLCQELVKRNIVPKFNFYLFLNDWEQEKIDGPNLHKYPFNIFPKFTTWQYIKDPLDETKTLVDFWERVIVNNINIIKYYYPYVTIKPIRNSQMKNLPIMKKCILKTIEEPEIVANILRKHTNKKILKKPLSYASAVCPNCRAAKGITSILEKDSLIHNCSHCGKISKGKYIEFDYWFYHKPLAVPRIKQYKIDICITGADHYKEGDYGIREDLMKEYDVAWPLPKTIYAPIILGRDGSTMGKSRGNAENISPDTLINLVKKFNNKSEIQIFGPIQ